MGQQNVNLETANTQRRQGESCRQPFPGLVIRLRPGCQELALERLDASATPPQLTPRASTGEPGGSGAGDKAEEQQRQDEEVEGQGNQKR